VLNFNKFLLLSQTSGLATGCFTH